MQQERGASGIPWAESSTGLVFYLKTIDLYTKIYGLFRKEKTLTERFDTLLVLDPNESITRLFFYCSTSYCLFTALYIITNITMRRTI